MDTDPSSSPPHHQYWRGLHKTCTLMLALAAFVGIHEMKTHSALLLRQGQQRAVAAAVPLYQAQAYKTSLDERRQQQEKEKEKVKEKEEGDTYITTSSTTKACPAGIENACPDGRCANLHFSSSGWELIGNITARIDNILTFLDKLSPQEKSLLPPEDSHVFIYTSDTITDAERKASPPLLVHTLPDDRVVELKETLFPNSYLLRDMYLPGSQAFFGGEEGNGEENTSPSSLDARRKTKTSPPSPSSPLLPFEKRKPKGYFLGAVRPSSQRLHLALLAQKHTDILDVHLVPDPSCTQKYLDEALRSNTESEHESVNGNASTSVSLPTKYATNPLETEGVNVNENVNISPPPPPPPSRKHMSKANYKYIISMNGASSSQWQLYRDFFLGSVVLRERGYQEYWTLDLQEHTHFLAFTHIDEIPFLISQLETNQTWAKGMAEAGRELVKEKIKRETVVGFALERMREAACVLAV